MSIVDMLAKGIAKGTQFLNKIPKAADDYYEPQLEKLGLSTEQLSKQNIHELEVSLKKLDEYIEKQDTFDKIKLKIRPDGEVTISQNDEGIEVGIGQTFLRKKKYIVDLIQELKSIEESTNLRSLIEDNVEEPKRELIIKKIDAAEKEIQAWRNKSKDVEREQNKAQDDIKIELAKLEAKGSYFEKRARVWQTLLARESVATVVGSILLLTITISLLIAMFTGTTPTDIVSNAYLVLLGYFFGQTVGKKQSGEDGK